MATPRDISGEPVRTGDTVVLRARVVSVHEGTDARQLVCVLAHARSEADAVPITVSSHCVTLEPASEATATPPPVAADEPDETPRRGRRHPDA